MLYAARGPRPDCLPVAHASQRHRPHLIIQSRKVTSKAATASRSTATTAGSDGISAAMRPPRRGSAVGSPSAGSRSCSVTAVNLALPQRRPWLLNRLQAAHRQSHTQSKQRGADISQIGRGRRAGDGAGSGELRSVCDPRDRARRRDLVHWDRTRLDSSSRAHRQPGRPGARRQDRLPRAGFGAGLAGTTVACRCGAAR